LQPSNNASFKYGEVVNFEGIANDLQDEAIDPAKLVWSNQFGTIGTGQRITKTDLPVGANFITLKATNAAGLTGQTQINKASAPATSRAEQMRRRTMDFLLLAAGRGPSLVRRSMAKWAAELKCRFALNSMPDGYGWGKAPGR
jgi:hypothetical protein